MTEPEESVTEPAVHVQRSLGSTITFGWASVTTQPPIHALGTPWRLSKVQAVGDAPGVCQAFLDAVQRDTRSLWHRDERAAEDAARALTRAMDEELRAVAVVAERAGQHLDSYARLSWAAQAAEEVARHQRQRQ